MSKLNQFRKNLLDSNLVTKEEKRAIKGGIRLETTSDRYAEFVEKTLEFFGVEYTIHQTAHGWCIDW